MSRSSESAIPERNVTCSSLPKKLVEKHTCNLVTILTFLACYQSVKETSAMCPSSLSYTPAAADALGDTQFSYP